MHDFAAAPACCESPVLPHLLDVDLVTVEAMWTHCNVPETLFGVVLAPVRWSPECAKKISPTDHHTTIIIPL